MTRENHLSRYLQEKTPFNHEVKFDLTLKDYPIDPILLPIPLNNELLEYETNSLEVLHRWMGFQNHGDQVDLDDMIDYELTNKPSEGGRFDQDELVDIVPKFILDQVKRAKEPAQRSSTLQINKTISQNTSQNNWLRLSKEQRVNIYMESIRNSFVDPKTLINPRDPNIKQKRVYKVMPNIQHWKNTYIHASISGGLDEIDNGKRGFMRVTDVTPTSKQYEYYSSSGMEGKSERFTFLRNYTCQHSTRGSSGENYYLILLPQILYRLAEKTVQNKSGIIRNDDQDSMDLDSDVVYIISIKGQKSVLTKAGGGKKSDYLITYRDDDDE